MTIRNLSTAFLFLIYSFLGHCNKHVPVIDTNFIINEIKKEVADPRILRLNTNFFESLLFVSDSVAYLNPLGTLHLFEIRFTDSISVTRLSTSVYHGFNFNRNFFMYDSVLYSLGGTGLFNQYPGIIYFDFEVGEWFEKVVSTFPNNILGVSSSWQYENNLYIIFEVNANPSASNIKEAAGTAYSYGVLDLTNFEFKELNILNNIGEEILTDFWRKVYSGERYDIFKGSPNQGGCLYAVLDKKDAVWIETAFTKQVGCINGESLIYSDNELLFIRHESGQLDSILVYDAKIFAKKDFKELYLTKTDEGANVIYGGVALGIIAILGSIFLYRRSQKNRINKIDELSALEIVLIDKIGLAMTREDLDELLQITHLSFESIKVKRSQMITALNKREKVVITRDRDPKDRRMFLYHISPY